HERLAESHHFAVGLPLGIEVRAPLGAAHRERREAVLERLLEAEEFQDRERDRRMEAQPALVRTDGVVELDAITSVHAHAPLVVLPRDAEDDDAVGLRHPLEDERVAVALVREEEGHERLRHFLHRLVELLLARIPPHEALHEAVDFDLRLARHRDPSRHWSFCMRALRRWLSGNFVSISVTTAFAESFWPSASNASARAFW